MSGGYFGGLGIRPAVGRLISSSPVVVISYNLWQSRFGGSAGAVGKSLLINGKPFIIEGVSPPEFFGVLPGAVIYLSYLQDGGKYMALGQMFFELRTIGNPLALAKSVGRIVHEIAPAVPVADITTESRIINRTIVQERNFAALCSCFGVLALGIACVGLYASTAYAVARRTNEIGIRMALGALQVGVVWMVISDVLAVGAVGMVVGVAVVWEATAFLKSFLFD